MLSNSVRIVCAMLVCSGALAQPAWKPERPVELIVTCQPGCGPDIAARTIQKIWQDALKKTTETPEWKRDLELHHQSDEFMAGKELAYAIDTLYRQLGVLLTELELAKPAAK